MRSARFANAFYTIWEEANLHIIGIPEGVEKDKGMENIFEEIIAGNFPNLKDTGFKIQEAQRAPNKLNPNRPTPRHIIIKMAKVSDKESNLIMLLLVLR